MHKFIRKDLAKAKAAAAAAKELYPDKYIGIWAMGTWETQSGDYVFFNFGNFGGRFITHIGRKWCRVEAGANGECHGKIKPTEDGYFEITAC